MNARGKTNGPGPWLRSPWWDGLWLLSGLWLLVPAFAYSAFPEAIRAGFVAATMLLWLAHRFATAFSAYCLPSFRELVHVEWRRFLLGPALIMASVFLIVLLPERFTGIALRERLLLLGTVFFLYNAYHFSAQHFGVLAIYRIRSGQSTTSRWRRFERTYSLLVTGVAVSVAQVLHGAAILQDTFAAEVSMAPPLSEWLTTLRPVVAGAIVLATAFLMASEDAGALLSPRRLYLASVGAQGITAYFLAAPAFLMLWAVQHWLVSVGLSAHMTENAERPDATRPEPSLWYRCWAPFRGRFWPSVLLLSALSVLLTPLFELALHPERLAIAAAWTSTLGARVLIGLAYGSVFTHFLLDRAAFRFSDPLVRRTTGRLLLGASS